MNINNEILLNQFAQEVIRVEILISQFNTMDDFEKKNFLTDIVNLIIQSNPLNNDIDKAIIASGLKSSYTPCVMLKKGISHSNLIRIVALPVSEYEKVFSLFVSIFKIAYSRRYFIEKDSPHKWWYWDLSKDEHVQSIIKKYTNENPEPV